MKEFMKKLSNVLRLIFGYSIMTTLFVGGLTLFGYIIALIIGGETAAAICTFIYKQIVPIMVYITNIMIVLGLVTMYISGETALTVKTRKNDGEH